VWAPLRARRDHVGRQLRVHPRLRLGIAQLIARHEPPLLLRGAQHHRPHLVHPRVPAGLHEHRRLDHHHAAPAAGRPLAFRVRVGTALAGARLPPCGHLAHAPRDAPQQQRPHDGGQPRHLLGVAEDARAERAPVDAAVGGDDGRAEGGAQRCHRAAGRHVELVREAVRVDALGAELGERRARRALARGDPAREPHHVGPRGGPPAHPLRRGGARHEAAERGGAEITRAQLEITRAQLGGSRAALAAALAAAPAAALAAALAAAALVGPEQRHHAQRQLG